MGGGKKHTSTSTNTLDPATQKMQQAVYDAANAAGNTAGVGPDAATLEALKGYQGAAGFGSQGLLALGGDAGAQAQFANPNSQNILDNIDTNAKYASQAATNATNQSATRAGAFGGSRAAVAQGTAQAGVNADAMNQKNAFSYQNSQDQYQREMAAANLGLGANQAQAGIGQYLQALAQSNDPNTRRLAMLKQGLMGTPYGTTTKNTTYTPWGSVIAGGIGAGLSAIGGGG